METVGSAVAAGTDVGAAAAAAGCTAAEDGASIVHLQSIRGRSWIGRQHASTVVLCLSAVDRLRKCGGSGRIHPSVGGVELVLLVELEVQTQPIVVVIHGDEGKQTPWLY